MGTRGVTFFEGEVPEFLKRIDGLDPHTVIKIVVGGGRPMFAVCRPEAQRLVEGLRDTGQVSRREARFLMERVEQSRLEDVDFPKEVLNLVHRYLRRGFGAAVLRFKGTDE